MPSLLPMTRSPRGLRGRGGWAILIALAALALNVPAGGTVSGHSAALPSGEERVATVAVYPVNFTEQYLPTGTYWTVTILGQTWNGTGRWIVATEPNGTYSYSAAAPALASYPPVNGSFTVAGRPVNVTLVPTSGPGAGGGVPSSSAGTSSAAAGWITAASVAVIGVLAVVVLALLVASRRSPPAGGPSAGPSPDAGPSAAPTPAGASPPSEDTDPMRHML